MNNSPPRYSSGPKLALTQIGECEVSDCRAPVYAELRSPDAPRLCFDCAPLLVARQSRYQELYERSGGRLPASFRSFLAGYGRLPPRANGLSDE
ncbi:MAG TPA: hypothetical protein VK363_19230 [Pyrinomonadaceae bacterium]|nr:hypothetical protein [Pyrinomonadaceae bacterium]